MARFGAGRQGRRRTAGWRVLVPAVALVVAACGGADGGDDEDAAALAERVAELEAQLADADAADPADDGGQDGGQDEAPADEADTAAAPAPEPEAAPEPDAAPEPEPEPEPADEPEPEPAPEPEPEADEADEPEEPEEAEEADDADVETQEADAAEPITIEMESQRRTNSGAFVVVVRARSDTGGSAWGITDVLMERPNEYNALLDTDASWLGPQTGQRDQWTASLTCDRQSKYKDWLFVTATDEQGRTLRSRFDVTIAC